MMTWTVAAPAISAAFLSSLVEAVEALTIVLAVGTVRGWRPAGLGAVAGLALLALIVLALGPLLDRVPLNLLQLAIGILLLLFGMRWLRKAILRAAGVIPLQDEAIAYAAETAQLREQASLDNARLDWLAALASFKAVVLEGLEVVFIVIARRRGTWPHHTRERWRDCGLPSHCWRWLRGSPAARASSREHAQIRGRRHALRIRRVLDRGGFWGRLAGRGHCNHRVCGALPPC